MIRYLIFGIILFFSSPSLFGQVTETWRALVDPFNLSHWRSGFHAEDSLVFVEQDSGWIYYNPLTTEAEFIATLDPLTGLSLKPNWSLWLANRAWFLANERLYYFENGKNFRSDSLWPQQAFPKVDYLFSDGQRLLFLVDSTLWIWQDDSLKSITVPWDVRQVKPYRALLAAHGEVYALSKTKVYYLKGNTWENHPLPQSIYLNHNTLSCSYLSSSGNIYLSSPFDGSFQFSRQAGLQKLTQANFMAFKKDDAHRIYGLSHKGPIVRIDAGTLDTLKGYSVYSLDPYFRGASNLVYGLRDYNGLKIIRLNDVGRPKTSAVLNNGIWQAGLSSVGGLFDQKHGPYGDKLRAQDPLNFQSLSSKNHFVTDAGLWLSRQSGSRVFEGSALKTRVFLDAGDLDYGPLCFRRDSLFRERYNRVWKVDQAMIKDFRMHYESTLYTIPDDILHWPAHGDTTNGEPWLLAPFVDLNYNDIYEPQKGDHPAIKGEAALLAIFNNARGGNESKISGLHTRDSLRIEGLVMMYQMPKTGRASDSTVFVDYKITNRGAPLQKLHIGMEARLHNRSSGSRFRACDSINNNAFVYPMNAYQGLWQTSFLSMPQGQMIGHSVVHSEEETSPVAFMPYNHFPMGPNHFFNYLNYYFCWGDRQLHRPTEKVNDSLIGVRLPYAGNHQYPRTNYQFDVHYNWKGMAGGIYQGQNRSSLIRHPNVDLETGASLCLSYAFHFSSSSKNWQEAVKKGIGQSKQIGNYLNGGQSCWVQITKGNQEKPQELLIQLWPNPVGSVLQIQLDPENDLIRSHLYSVNGTLVASYGAQKSISVDLLKPGLYVLECETAKGRAVERFIKRW